MVTVIKKGGSIITNIVEMNCLSIDEKPINDNIPNGSFLFEMDTNKRYRYDAENHRWIGSNATTI